jgi:hypothetical protein
VRKQHRAALNLSKVLQFVLYSLRHTFLTRVGASCGDPWTLARIAGHSSIAISSRYVHPSENSVLDAMERMGGHKTGHGEESAGTEESGSKRRKYNVSAEISGERGWTRTIDPCLKRALLCQLSYAPTVGQNQTN